MQVRQAIDAMLETTDSTMTGVSKAMGRSRNFLHVSLNDKKSIPQVDTLARIAETMGFELVLEGHGERFVIDP